MKLIFITKLEQHCSSWSSYFWRVPELERYLKKLELRSRSEHCLQKLELRGWSRSSCKIWPAPTPCFWDILV